MKIISVEYVNPKVSISNRDWRKIRQKWKEGYYVCERDTGVVVLEKEPKIIVTMECDNGEIIKKNLKDKIKQFYGKDDMKTEEAFEKFKEQVACGKIEIVKEEQIGYFSIKATG